MPRGPRIRDAVFCAQKRPHAWHPNLQVVQLCMFCPAELARRTSGFSSADLVSICQKAAMHALRREQVHTLTGT
eukprot:6194335-Pleurochrysis_carterae.AAC.4